VLLVHATLPPKRAKKRKLRTCPKCGSEKVAEIAYGWFPQLTDELDQALKNGTITLGGCVTDHNAPRWECKECGKNWGKTRM